MVCDCIYPINVSNVIMKRRRSGWLCPGGFSDAKIPNLDEYGQCLMRHDVLACVVSKLECTNGINMNVGIGRLALNVDEMSVV